MLSLVVAIRTANDQPGKISATGGSQLWHSPPRGMCYDACGERNSAAGFTSFIFHLLVSFCFNREFFNMALDFLLQKFVSIYMSRVRAPRLLAFFYR